jgi:hypothetical protein
MSKKDFIALANAIQFGNRNGQAVFSPAAINALADFCERQNPQFKRERWLDYLAGKVDPNGGRVV